MRGYKTYIGIALTAVIGVAAIFGIEPATHTPAWLDASLMLLAAGFAAYGRRAKELRAPE